MISTNISQISREKFVSITTFCASKSNIIFVKMQQYPEPNIYSISLSVYSLYIHAADKQKSPFVFARKVYTEIEKN